MLDKIKLFFQQNLTQTTTATTEVDLHTAIAALLIEVMRADNEQNEQEQHSLALLISKYFSLSDSQTAQLITQASEQLDDAIDYYRFSHQINAATSAQQRIEIITLFWQLAYADNHLDKYEESVIRRVASLLYVTHEDFIKAKLLAQKHSNN